MQHKTGQLYCLDASGGLLWIRRCFSCRSFAGLNDMADDWQRDPKECWRQRSWPGKCVMRYNTWRGSNRSIAIDNRLRWPQMPAWWLTQCFIPLPFPGNPDASYHQVRKLSRLLGTARGWRHATWRGVSSPDYL